MFFSAEKSPPFLDKYKTTKREAEEFLLNECPNLKPTILRPYFIWSKEEKSWTATVKTMSDLMANTYTAMAKVVPLYKQVDWLFPAHSVKLSTVTHFAIEGVLGNLEEKIITNDMLLKYEEEHK